MNTVYIVTGAKGHLGSTIVRQLKRQGQSIRGLILPGESAEDDTRIQYIRGDVRKRDSLLPLFDGLEDREVIVIHTAGVVDISGAFSRDMYDVNVNGTRNMVQLCLQYAVKRLVYVSSVHAIPESSHWKVMQEIRHFSAAKVEGGYAKTKAEATQVVLDAVSKGLNAVVVHPSGILGPYDNAGNHLVQMVNDYLHGKLPACVQGGYDFVDVRDVAAGCVAAAEKGRTGECYILSNRHYDVKEVLQMVREVQGGRRLPVLPVWMAKAAAPAMSWVARRRRHRPLYTAYSLNTLHSNDRFSHDKATRELQYHPRDLFQTIVDTVAWLQRRSAVAAG